MTGTTEPETPLQVAQRMANATIGGMVGVGGRVALVTTPDNDAVACTYHHVDGRVANRTFPLATNTDELSDLTVAVVDWVRGCTGVSTLPGASLPGASPPDESEPYVDTGMTVPIERITDDALFMRTALGTGKLGERPFNISMGMDGSLFIEFAKKPGEIGLGHDRYVVRLTKMTEVVAKHVADRDAMPTDDGGA